MSIITRACYYCDVAGEYLLNRILSEDEVIYVCFDCERWFPAIKESK